MEGVRNVTHHQSRSPHIPCTSGFGCFVEGRKAGVGPAEAQPPPEKQLCFWIRPRVQSSTNTERLPDLAPPPSQLLTLNICTLVLSVESITTVWHSDKRPQDSLALWKIEIEALFYLLNFFPVNRVRGKIDTHLPSVCFME